MRKRAIMLAAIGYVIGCAVGLCFALQNKNRTLADALPRILLGGIPGAITMGSAVIYDVEKWSILRVTATHFLIVAGVMVLACFALNWFEPGSAAFWILMAVMLAGYILIGLIMYCCFRAKVRKLNEMLKENRETDA